MDKLSEVNNYVAYSASLQKLQDIRSVLDYSKKESYNEGVSEGFERGRVEGLRESALKMLNAGLNSDFIRNMTGITIEEIKNLK